MNTSKIVSFVTILLFLGIVSCDIVDPDQINDTNNPSVSEVLENANQAQLQNIISGLEVRHRTSTVGFTDVIGSFGR